MAAQLFPVKQDSFPLLDLNITHYVTGTVAAADTGKAVTFDTTTPTAVKLTGDGAEIVGRLETLEIRAQEGITVGTIALGFIDWLPVDPAAIATLVLYDSVQGAATPGFVKRLATPNWSKNRVVALKTDTTGTYALVQKTA